MCANLSSVRVWVKWVELERIGDSLIWVWWISLAVPFHVIVFMFIWYSFPITQWSISYTESTHCPSSTTEAFHLSGIAGLIYSIPSFNFSIPDGYCILFSAEPFLSQHFSLPYHFLLSLVFLFSPYDTFHPMCITFIIILYSHIPSILLQCNFLFHSLSTPGVETCPLQLVPPPLVLHFYVILVP